MSILKTMIIATVALTVQVHAQSLPTAGTLIIMPAFGEVSHTNDEAIATLMIEEQDKDKAIAASRVNRKMKQGIEIIKQADSQANLKTQAYYTYPVYPEDRPLLNGAAPKVRVPSSWRVGQALQVTTSNLSALPKTIAAAQNVLTLNGLQFGLSRATGKKLDAQRIAATYENLNERMSAVAAAMGRKVSDAVLDSMDFEGSGAYAQQDRAQAEPMLMRGAMMKSDVTQVQEPSFEPGTTTLQMRLVGKIKFK